MIFVEFTFFTYAVETYKKFEFLRIKFQNFLKSQNCMKWFLHYKRALKNDFLIDLVFFTFIGIKNM